MVCNILFFFLEDTVEELPENLPSIRSLKSRFESDKTASSPSPVVKQQQQQPQQQVQQQQHQAVKAHAPLNGFAGSDDVSATSSDVERDREIVRETREKDEVKYDHFLSRCHIFTVLVST